MFSFSSHLVLILEKRFKEFIAAVISSDNAVPQQCPLGLSAFKDELAAVTGSFLHLITYNRKVFTTFYDEILKNLLNQCDSSWLSLKDSVLIIILSFIPSYTNFLTKTFFFNHWFIFMEHEFVTKLESKTLWNHILFLWFQYEILIYCNRYW